MADLQAYVVGPRPVIRVGDAVDVQIVVTVDEPRDDIALDWQIGWIADGRTADTQVVASGSEPIDHIHPDDEITWNIPFVVPKAGPPSYRGALLEVRWFVKVSLDIPWAIDPKAVFAFEVKPKRVKRSKRR